MKWVRFIAARLLHAWRSLIYGYPKIVLRDGGVMSKVEFYRYGGGDAWVECSADTNATMTDCLFAVREGKVP